MYDYKTATIELPKRDKDFKITHRCFVCDRLEYPGASLTYNRFWLCEDCCKKVKDVLYPLGLTYLETSSELENS